MKKKKNNNNHKKALELASRLTKEGLESSSPSPDLCIEFLNDLDKEFSKIVHESQSNNDNNGKTNDSAAATTTVESTMKSLEQQLNRAGRSFKRHRRTASTEQKDTSWDDAIDLSNKIVTEIKKQQKMRKKKINNNNNNKGKSNVDLKRQGLPQTVAEYRARLVQQKKDMYKDPPVLPPSEITIEPKFCPLPKRDQTTGLLTFTANDDQVKQLLKDFHPNRTPEEVLCAGAFGGTYFRSIVSAVTNIQYDGRDVVKDTLPKEWMNNNEKQLSKNISTLLTSKTYHQDVNKFGVKCGGSLGMWESSGWITSIDPYGWFQWYCRFYQGRRSSDDARQISRWLKSAGPKGRFRSQLCNKILAAKTSHDDAAISPVIRQTLLHWGLEITKDILTKHKKRVK